MLHNHLSRLVAVLALVGSAGCVTSLQTTRQASTSDWLEPSPNLRNQIEDEAKRLPWTHGMERVEAIHWFARVGEPAYPTLLAMVLDPRKDVAGAALAALGATGDSRLVEPLRELPWPEGHENTDLSLERARTLLRLGDWQMVPILVGGLRDERMITRALCIQALDESTNERFDFDPRAEPDVREIAVRRWETWVSDRLADPLLAQGKPPQPTVSKPQGD